MLYSACFALLCLCFAFPRLFCALLFFATSNAKCVARENARDNAKDTAKDNARDNAKDNAEDNAKGNAKGNANAEGKKLRTKLSHVTVFCSLPLVMP